MKNLVYIVLIFMVNSSLFAQISCPLSLDTSEQKNEIYLRSSHDIQASSLQLNLMSKLIKGGLISDEIIHSNSLKQKDINHLGREFTNELKFVSNSFFKNSKKLNQWNFLTEVNYNSLFGANYSNDLFQLLFKGNSNFIGDTANFSGTNFKYIDFQSIGFGLSNKKSKSSLSLNLVTIQNYFDVNSSSAELIFAQDSSELQANVNASIRTSTTEKFSNGLGLGLNFNFNILVPWRDESSAFFQFNVRNFGFAKVNNLVQYKIDTTLNYKGFDLEALVGLNSDLFQNSTWQDTLNVKQDTISSWIMLPTMIQFGKVLQSDFAKKIQSYFGIKLYPSLKYIPKVYLGFDYKMNSFLHAGISAAYGGFGNLRAGLYLQYQKEKMSVGLGTEDFYGLVSKKGFGQMLSVNFKVNW